MSVNRATISRTVLIAESSVANRYYDITETGESLKVDSTASSLDVPQARNRDEERSSQTGRVCRKSPTSSQNIYKDERGNSPIRLFNMTRTTPYPELESWKGVQRMPEHENQKQIDAINEKTKSLVQLHTWDLTHLPQEEM